MGWLAGSFCPHWDEEPLRKPVYRELVRTGQLPAGLAADGGAYAAGFRYKPAGTLSTSPTTLARMLPITPVPGTGVRYTGVIGKPLKYTTDLQGALDGKHGDYDIFFDASGTLQRARFIEMAVKAKKALYCEKPTAVTTAQDITTCRLCSYEAVSASNASTSESLARTS